MTNVLLWLGRMGNTRDRLRTRTGPCSKRTTEPCLKKTTHKRLHICLLSYKKYR